MTSPLNFILLLGAVHPAAAAAPVGVNAQRFVPSEGAPLFLAVTDSPVGPAWSLGGAATFSFAQQPFLYDYEDPNQESLVLLDHIGTAHLQVWGNLPRVRIGLELPLNVASSGYDVDGFRLIGDSHVEVTGEILKRTRVRPFGLGARLRAALPSGAQEAWLGNKSPTIGGDVLFSAAGGPVVLAMNLGVESGGGAVLDGVAWGPELDFGLGVGVGITEDLGLSAEFFGSHSFASGLANATPAEVMGGLWLRPVGDLVVRAGAGAGLSSGVGAPAWRGLVGLSWSPEMPDRPKKVDTDGDGILDYRDLCPQQPEDSNGKADTDGCPEDSRIPTAFRVVDERGSSVGGAQLSLKSGPETGDWRLVDGQLQRSLLPGTYEVVVTADGYSPLTTKAEVGGTRYNQTLSLKPVLETGRVGMEVRDPEGNLITARVRVLWDKGEAQLEAKEGLLFTALPPNRYTVVISADGYRSAQKSIVVDGGERINVDLVLSTAMVTVGADQLLLTDRVYFETDSAELKRRSFPLLDEVAQILVENPQLDQIAIIGHTDDQGDEAYNLTLSQQRAESVRRWLVNSGVDPARLTVIGAGESQPLMPGTSEEARAANRRVTFQIIHRQESP